MKFWIAVSILVAASCAAPVQHYGYDFHVTMNNELESLAQTSHQQIEPVYVRAPTYYNPRLQPAILRQQNSGDPSTGSWSWGYETENGISFAEEGHLQRSTDRNDNGENGLYPVVRGQYSYTGPDGVIYTVTYYADETGFHPSGAHLPASAL